MTGPEFDEGRDFAAELREFGYVKRTSALADWIDQACDRLGTAAPAPPAASRCRVCGSPPSLCEGIH